MEKSLYNQVGEVKGAASEAEDSFSFQFTPQNENLKRTRGALFTLVSVKGKVENRYEAAKNIYHQFQSSYYAKASGSILHGLSDTLEHLVKTSLKKEADGGVQISIIAAVFWGTVVYLSKHGEGAVYVARADKVKKLEFAKVASGVLEDQDTVLLATETFVKNIPTEELSEVLTKEKFEETLETLDEKISGIEGAVCDVVRLSVNAPKEEPEALSIAAVDEKGRVEEPSTPELEEEVPETLENAPAPTEEIEEEKEVLAEDQDEVPMASAAPATANQDPFETKSEKKENPLASILAKAKPKLFAIFASISKPWKKQEPGEYYDPVAIRRARIIQIVVVIVIVLFLSIAFGVFSRGSEEKSNEVTAIITKIEGNLNEAANIKAIDPNRALLLVEAAQKDIEEAKKIDEDNQKLSELEDKGSDLKAEITKTKNVDLSPQLDFENFNADSNVTKVALLGETILVIDPGKGALYQGNSNDDSVSQVSEASSPQNISSYPGGFYLTSTNGISRLDTSLKISNAGSNANWGKIVDSATFQNNLYLLDTEKNEIWRYLSTSSGLGGARAYVTGEKPDMTNSVAIAIDDIVWVANKNGTVYKFAAGKRQQDFTISGLADPVGELSDMFTNSSTKNHYFLDKGKARIIVSDKAGVYQEAFANDQLHNASSLVVDEEKQLVFVTVGNKLYKFQLP